MQPEANPRSKRNGAVPQGLGVKGTEKGSQMAGRLELSPQHDWAGAAREGAELQANLHTRRRCPQAAGQCESGKILEKLWSNANKLWWK